MFLSKVIVSGAASRNPYEVHRALWRLFPEDAAAQRDFLFRIERCGQQSSEILLQSLREPSILVERDVRLLANRPYALSLSVGQRVRFKLIANPVRTIYDEYGRMNARGAVKKCRVPLVGDEDLQSWLVRKLEGMAKVEAVVVEKSPAMNFRKAREKRAGKVQPVCFEGAITVLDPERLKNLVSSGIGPAKAFGCGLLSLARG